MLHDSCKSLWLVDGELGEDLAVECYTSSLDISDQAAIGGAILPSGSVDASDPQLAQVTLAVAAVAVGVLQSPNYSLRGERGRLFLV